MKVVLDRRIKMSEFTVGDWIIDGKKLCDSMEDCDRGLHQGMSLDEIKKKKVYGETAIPAGHYKIKMTYSPKYKRAMPHVMNVKGFSGIRIHSGNTAKDSLGCILLGKNDKVGWISNSRATCAEFERRLIAAGGTCELEIR